jgi:hypothetical protein
MFGGSARDAVPISDFVGSGMIHETNMKRPMYGMKNYAIQDSTLKAGLYKIANKSNAVFSTKTDKRNFIDEHKKNTGWQPAAKYNVSYDWSQNFGKRGRWPKGKRITSTESEMGEARKRNIPAPSHYKLKSQIEIDLKSIAHDAKSEKSCSIIEEARFCATQTPGHKYNQNKDHTFYNRTLASKIFPEPKTVKPEDNRLGRIMKDKSKPAEGDYKFMDGFNYCSHKDRMTNFKIGNPKLQCCAVEYAKKKDWVPAPNKYKYDMSAFAKLS